MTNKIFSKITFLMQKNFFISLICLTVSITFLISCKNNVKKKKNDWEEYGLKGKVYSLKERHYDAYKKFGKILRSKDSFICFTNSEEEEPNFVSKEQNENFSRDLFFDKDGLISEKNQYVNVNFAHKFKYEYKHDARYKYLKNEKGNNSNYHLLEIEKYNNDGKIIELDRFHHYPYNERLEYKKIYLYKQDGYIGVEALYELPFISLKQTSYVYLSAMLPPYIEITDPEGNEIIEVYTDCSFKILSEKTYNYKFQRALGHSSDLDGKTVSSCTYTFDSSGNIITTKIRFGDIKLYYFYEYEYDKVGNWIKRVEYNSDSVFSNKLEPNQIAEREIHYYRNSSYNNNIIYVILGPFLGLVVLIAIWYWKKNKN